MKQFEVSYGNDTKDFLKHAVSYISSLPSCNFSFSQRSEAERVALAHLGLTNINQLRDRFEGQTYLNNFRLRLMSMLILEKLLDRNLIDWSEVESNREKDYLKVEVDGVEHRVIPFFYGSLPIMNIKNLQPVILCVIRPDFKSGALCGKLDQSDIQDSTLFIDTNQGTSGEFAKFIRFDKLKSL